MNQLEHSREGVKGERPEIASKSSAIVLHGYGSRSKRIFHSS